MKSFTNTLIGIIMLSILAWFVPNASANPDDRFWDASGSQGAVTLKAKYKESPENRLVDQSLESEVKNAPANIRLFVFINGHQIGSVQTDGFGTARFSIDKLGNTPGMDGRPTGIRINDGDVISMGVGNQRVSGTFQERP